MYIFLAQLALAAAFFVVGELLRPKPEYEDAEAVPYEEANIPSTDTGKKQSVIWGRVDLRSPHVMDFPFYTQIPISKKIKTGLFSSTEVDTGFRYLVGMQLGICKQIDTIHKIWVDDRSVPFTLQDNGDDGINLTIDEPSFLGGLESGGGLKGVVTIYKGTSTQNANSYLGSFRSLNPAYRWTAYAVLNSFEVGETPNIKTWGFQVSRYPDPLSLGDTINVIGDDLNPMSMVYEILRDDDYGFALSVDRINASTFSAAAGVLKTEGNGISLKWTNNQSIERLIDTVNRQVDGVLRYNPFSGKWEYKLIREDYVINDLPVLDETNVIKLTTYARASWNETINVMEVQYSQLDSLNKPPPAMADDPSNFIRQGRQKVQQLNFPGCYNRTLAAAIAAREMKTYGFPLSTNELTVDREGFDLLPGDAFVFSWNQLGVTQLVFRVGDIGFGTDDQLELNISGVEDIFSSATAVFTSPPLSGWISLVSNPIDVSVFRIDDTPYVIAKDDPNQGVTLKDTAMALVETPQNNGLSFNLFTRQGTNAFTVKNTGTYLPSGTLQSSLSESTVDTVSSVVIEGVLSSPAIDTLTRNDTELQQGFQNLALLISTVDDPFEQLGSGAKYLAEWVSYEGASIVGTTVTLTNVHRGMLDSLPAAYDAGDRVWFITGAEINGPALSPTLLDGTTAEAEDAQLQNVATTGESGNTSTTTFTSRNRINLPYPGGGFTLNGNRYPSTAVALGGDVLAAWYHRNRSANVILYQDETIDQQASAGVPETGFEYILDIYDDTATAINVHLRRVLASGSTIGAGGAAATDTFDDSSNSSFDYTNALQTTDGGPYTRYRFELRVTNAADTVKNIINVIRLIDVNIV